MKWWLRRRNTRKSETAWIRHSWNSTASNVPLTNLFNASTKQIKKYIYIHIYTTKISNFLTISLALNTYSVSYFSSLTCLTNDFEALICHKTAFFHESEISMSLTEPRQWRFKDAFYRHEYHFFHLNSLFFFHNYSIFYCIYL